MSEEKVVKMGNKKVTVGRVEYTLQKPSARGALELRKNSKDRQGNPDEIKMYENFLEHVIVSPKVTIDDFADVATLEELMNEVAEFVYVKKN